VVGSVCEVSSGISVTVEFHEMTSTPSKPLNMGNGVAHNLSMISSGDEDRMFKSMYNDAAMIETTCMDDAGTFIKSASFWRNATSLKSMSVFATTKFS